MDEHRSGEGGAANMPPFPRLADQDKTSEETPASSAASETDGIAAGPNGAARASDRSEDPLDTSRRNLPGDEPDIDTASLGDEALRDRPFITRAGGELRRRAEKAAARGFERIADQLDDVAERIGRVSENRLSDAGGAGNTAHLAVDWMGGAADYLRSNELSVMQHDLETRTREKPLQTLLLALGAGWILGRIIR